MVKFISLVIIIKVCNIVKLFKFIIINNYCHWYVFFLNRFREDFAEHIRKILCRRSGKANYFQMFSPVFGNISCIPFVLFEQVSRNHQIIMKLQLLVEFSKGI